MLIVTLISIAVAVAMSALTWKVVKENNRRSDARVAALAADIRHWSSASEGDIPLRDDAPVGELFTAGDAARTRRPLAAVFGVGALVVCGAAAVAIVLSSGARPVASALSRPAAEPPRAAASTASQAVDLPSLELLALGHDREDDRLTVRGVVRNAVSGAAVDHLTAVVLLFNQEGGFLTSGRAALTEQTLTPGAESRFLVTIPGAAGVGRYRVSFRTEDRVVPHVDRRVK
jgi:hypothetical protein